MKKIKLLQSMLLLFAVFTLSNCEEDGAIEFIVKDSFPTDIEVKGLIGLSSYTTNSEDADISNLLDGATTFIEANVETISLALKNYSGSSINGNMKVKMGSLVLINQDVNLSATPTVIAIPAGSSNILQQINSGTISISLEGTTAEPIEDNDFIIVVTPTIKGKV